MRARASLLPRRCLLAGSLAGVDSRRDVMSFPISSQGELTFRSWTDPQAVCDAVTKALAGERPTALSCGDGRIDFAGGLSAGGFGNWHLLQPISKGAVVVIPGDSALKVHYELRFTQMLVLSSLMVLGVSAPVVFHMGVVDAVGVSCGLWIWLFGANYALTVFRFRNFLRRAVARHASDEV